MARAFKPERAFFSAVGRAFSELRLVGVLVFLNLLVALIFSLPTLFPAIQWLGHSPASEGQAFPSTAVMYQFPGAFARGGGAFFAGSALLSMITSFALQFLLSGGIAQRAWIEGPFRLSELLSSSVRLLGRNLRLFAWSLPGLLIALALVGGSAALCHALEWPTVFTQKPETWIFGRPLGPSALVQLVFTALVLGCWRASVDLGRVKLVADDERKTRKAAWRAFKRMSTSPLAWLGYCALSGAGLLATLVMMRLHGSMTITRTGGAWLALLAAQAVLWVRLAFMVATYVYAAELQRATPAPVPAAPTPPEPEPVAAPEP